MLPDSQSAVAPEEPPPISSGRLPGKSGDRCEATPVDPSKASNKKKPRFRGFFIQMVRVKGLEPSRVAPPEPKSGASAIPPHPHVAAFRLRADRSPSHATRHNNKSAQASYTKDAGIHFYCKFRAGIRRFFWDFGAFRARSRLFCRLPMLRFPLLPRQRHRVLRRKPTRNLPEKRPLPQFRARFSAMVR